MARGRLYPDDVIKKVRHSSAELEALKKDRKCLVCGEPIPMKRNLAAVYCSVKCKHKKETQMKQLERIEPDTVQPEPYVPIIAHDEPKPRTVYMNNDFERFIATRRAKTIFDL